METKLPGDRSAPWGIGRLAEEEVSEEGLCPVPAAEVALWSGCASPAPCRAAFHLITLPGPGSRWDLPQVEL